MAANLTKELEGFFISLGFDVDDAGVKRMSETVKDTVVNMRGLVTAAGVAAGALSALIFSTINSGEELSDFAVANGVSAAALQELGYAAGQSGSDLAAVRSSVETLNSTIGEAAVGLGRGKMTFEKFGLSAKDANGQIKTFDVMLAEISEKMKKLSLQESIALANKTGVDRSLVPLLRQGGAAIESLRLEARALGVQSDEQLLKTGALSAKFKTFFFAIQSVKDEIVTGLFPAVEGSVDSMRDWIAQNREFIRSGATAAAQAFSTALGHVWRWTKAAVGGVVDVVSWLGQFRIVVIAAVAALGIFLAVGTARVFGTIAIAIFSAARALLAFNFAAVLIPALIGAAIIAIGVLIDDFFVWKEGGKSLLEDVFGKFPDAIEKLKGFFAPLNSIIAFFENAYKAASKFGEYVRNGIGGALQGLTGLLGSIPGISELRALATQPGSPAAMSGALTRTGLLGTAASSINNSASSVDSSTRIQELNITVNAPDSVKAGESVVAELGKRGMIMTRNAQSRVLK